MWTSEQGLSRHAWAHCAWVKQCPRRSGWGQSGASCTTCLGKAGPEEQCVGGRVVPEDSVLGQRGDSGTLCSARAMHLRHSVRVQSCARGMGCLGKAVHEAQCAQAGQSMLKARSGRLVQEAQCAGVELCAWAEQCLRHNVLEQRGNQGTVCWRPMQCHRSLLSSLTLRGLPLDVQHIRL